MRLVVCLKQVPDTAEVRIDPETNTLVRQGIDNVMNPLDAYALEEAVRLVERFGGEVVAVSMGPPQAEAVLRRAVALGADRAMLVSGREFAGSDTWSTSYALACFVRHLGDVDMVLCGKQAIDGDTAQVGPGIAAHLGWPQATYVTEVMDVSAGTVTVRCAAEEAEHIVATDLPCVLTAVKELNEPRVPTLARQMRARRMQVSALGAAKLGADLSELGLDGSPTRVVSIFAPEVEHEGRRIEAPTDDDLSDLAEYLVQHCGGADAD